LFTGLAGQEEFIGYRQNIPAGVLRPGDQLDIYLNFTANSGASAVTFNLYTVDDPNQSINWNSASMQPSWIPSDAWAPIYTNFLAQVGSTWGQYNHALASDVSYLSTLHIYEYRVSQLQVFELMKAGLDTISSRYHFGAFGRGASHPFDIWGEPNGTGWLIHYPSGTTRPLVYQVVARPGSGSNTEYVGGFGDDAVMVPQASNQGYLLTEKSGIVYHFLPNPNNGSNIILDYIQDLNGNKTTVSYTNGLATSATDTKGDTISYTYDRNRRITQMTDPVGRVTTYGYDSQDEHLLTITNAAGTTTLTYVTGQGAAQEHAIQSITKPDGTHTYYQYDLQGRVNQVYKDGGAESVTFAYNSFGQVTTTDALGNSWVTSPNDLGSVSLFQDPLINLTQTTFDPEGRTSQRIGADSSTTTISYDTSDNVANVQDPLSNKQSTLFSPNGYLESLTDTLGNATSNSYDSAFNLTGITYPDTRQEVAAYDSRGNLTSWTNRRGQTIQYTYDGKNLLTQKTHSNGVTETYSYDSHRNLQTATGPAGAINFTYDSADRITQVTYPNGTFLKYSYDSGGRRSSMRDQTGFTVNYGYDAAGRLSQITSASSALIASYTYDSVGRLSQKNLGNGAYSTYTYDPAGNLLHLVNYSGGAVNSRFDYTYDAAGRRIGMGTLAGTWSYGYDANGQLTSVIQPSGLAITYKYDAAGNRTYTVTGGSSLNYYADNLNQYTVAGSTAFTYDADGNMNSQWNGSQSWTYGYDDQNRLVSLSGPQGMFSFTYDSLGNRYSQSANGTVTSYLVDPTGLPSVIGSFGAGGTALDHFAYGVGLESISNSPGSFAYYQFDGSSNTAAVTNASQNVLDSYAYLPFGELASASESLSNPFRYGGQLGVSDDGDGLYYMRTRAYSPLTGRFISQDPLRLQYENSNAYTYAANNPVSLSDPTGLRTVLEPSGTVTLVKFFPGDGPQLLRPTGEISQIIPSPEPVDLGTLIHSAEPPYTAYELAFLDEVGVGAPLLGIFLEGETIACGPGESCSDGRTIILPPPPQASSSLCLGTLNGACIMPEQPSFLAATATIPVGRSSDPNGKITVGYGNQGFIPPDATITYTIYFENQASATLPAQKVVVTDPLDSNLDWSTVQLTQIGFNNATLNIPAGVQSYSVQSNVSTDPNPVSVSASLDPNSGTLTWTMQSIDPTTGSIPQNPLAGFLPPDNSSRQGEGFMVYTVKPKPGVANGTTIYNQASIVFDLNAAIQTNQVTNTIDSIYPTSSVTPLPATTTSASFPVSWTGTNPSGSGIATYDIFCSDRQWSIHNVARFNHSNNCDLQRLLGAFVFVLFARHGQCWESPADTWAGTDDDGYWCDSADDHLHRPESHLWRCAVHCCSDVELKRSDHILGGLRVSDHLRFDGHADWCGNGGVAGKSGCNG
jgi:RHS repeat-associated protein/uncharacterized repeat protein (TIGR01451 family)